MRGGSVGGRNRHGGWRTHQPPFSPSHGMMSELSLLSPETRGKAKLASPTSRSHCMAAKAERTTRMRRSLGYLQERRVGERRAKKAAAHGGRRSASVREQKGLVRKWAGAHWRTPAQPQRKPPRRQRLEAPKGELHHPKPCGQQGRGGASW